MQNETTFPKLWQNGRIMDLPINIIDGDRSHRYPKVEEFQKEGIIFLNTTNIRDNKLDCDNANFISNETFAKLTKGKLKLKDIILTTRGSIGKVALFNNPKFQTGFINAQMLIIRPDADLLDSVFLYYFFCGEYFQRNANNFATGSAQPQLPIQSLNNIEIYYPIHSNQRKIAAILSAYDDLIDNNTHRIKILEGIAQIIYQEWFVNFRFPGHEYVKMVESDLGLVPEGWEIVKVIDAVTINPKINLPKEGIKPFLSMGCLSGNTMNVQTIEYREGNSGTKFQNGDTLFARITPCLENGKTVFIQFLPTDTDIAFGSTEFIVLRSKILTPEFVYLLSRTDSFRDNAIKSMSGATGRQRVQEECFKKYFIAHPDAATLKAFDEVIKPIFQSVFSLSLKNTNLRRTRDLLLPKLISGELDVSDLDIRIPEAEA